MNNNNDTLSPIPWMSTMVIPEAAPATIKRRKCCVIREKQSFLLNVAQLWNRVQKVHLIKMIIFHQKLSFPTALDSNNDPFSSPPLMPTMILAVAAPVTLKWWK